MNVLLIQDVKGLGALGDEIKVKDGYARNYLIPQKMAMQATPSALRLLDQKKKEKARREKQIKAECQQMAEKINALSYTITMEAGEEEKLFGAVTSDMIAESLQAEGIDIDKRKIELAEPIKVLGVYSVDIKLHAEVKAQARIWVVKK